MAGNNALIANLPTTDRRLPSTSPPAESFHLLPIVILTTAAIPHFSMAADLGGTPVQTELFGHRHQNQGATRAIWHVRYIDWVITTPLLLMELLLGTGLPLSDIFVAGFMDIAIIIASLVPAFLAFLWLLYPIAWGLSDGGNVIHPDSKMVFYGVLDILAKPVFIFIHLLSLRALDMSRFCLTGGGVGGIWAVQAMRTEGYFNEKPCVNMAAAAPVNRPFDPLPAAAA
ncbi:family A G protein-coupled receptor-like protein [Calocera cornea HHB12733]|uniref:Family A G protein-coupled receptor-like protein n=1 Tax=Calocera cornea HHB12733 TaxID=1353952 RepID=A0A165JJN9_9BASI|nr:family A G protein-coupled receptor-like protein [Calocera cornea HHB12733]